ncbi:MAG: acyltransferase domain-containing protein, partial [Acidobacteria bacterium]|nr:acyltransferase domain-containing protein [Acidobacteriota bacterium]
ARLKKILGRDIPIVKLFKYPTIRDLSAYLAEEAGEETGELALGGDIIRGKELLKDKVSQGNNANLMDIAVVGMAGYFPGASNVQEFWENLKNGVESITFYTVEELAAAGVSPRLLQDANFVRAASIMEGIDHFDASFFNYTPREAALMDPQVRIFHQCAWHALEDAGYDPYAYERRIGLYAGSSPSFSWEVLAAFSGVGGSSADWFQAEQLWDKDFLCSRVSYRLNLKGPSFSIQTACSTSLVAVHLAVQGLLNGDCEMALAGGVTIHYPPRKGYLYQPGLVNSPDGHCRAFDALANGTVGGNGAAVVLLKRLADARQDHDNIHAIIKGSAINNDGFRKVSYTAPSVEGQAEVIRAALVAANIQPESISYIEAHGTGTELGDPVEIEALKLAFNTRKKNFCGIGSVKTNIGHLDTAAGTTGLIKTILALKHHLIPASLHFHAPNPKLDLENSPFYVVSRLTPWQAGSNQPRRAGVSSLGIGGTNAHVIVEENTPGNIQEIPQTRIKKNHLLLLSARTRPGLEQATQNLVKYLENNLNIDPANMAYTLQVGRRAFEYREILACPDIHTAVENLSKAPMAFCPGVFTGKIVFLFPGQGSQYVNMGSGLYKTEPLFREELDRCLEILAPLVKHDMKEILYPGTGNFLVTNIDQTEIAQPLIFSIQYALSRLLNHYGIIPAAVMGHSIGEYVAAHLAGVFSLEDALKLVAVRGQLMQELPPGAMLGVPLPVEELTSILKNYPDISLAAVNNISQCVVSGPHEAIEKLSVYLKEKGCDSRRIHTSHAFHSRMMEPILAKFTTEALHISRSKPKIPYISNLTGEWISEQEVMDPAYWSRHLRGTVQFSRGLELLMKEDSSIFIEIGPGRSLSTMVNRHEAKKAGHIVVALMRHPHENIPDDYTLLNAIGQLWLYGVDIHWPNLYPKGKVTRITLPGYPFEKINFRVDDGLLKNVLKMITSFNVTNVNPPAPQEAQAFASEIAPPRNRTVIGVMAEEFQAPRNEFEKKIVLMWQEVLGFDKISIHHNFFNLNGDSLSATQIISRVKDAFQVEVPLKDFFAEPTVAQLAQKVKLLLVEKIKNLSPAEKQKIVRGKRNQGSKENV